MIALQKYAFKSTPTNPIGFRVWDLRYNKWNYNPSVNSAALFSFGVNFYPKDYELISFNTLILDRVGEAIYDGDIIFLNGLYFALGGYDHARQAFVYNLEKKDSPDYNTRAIQYYLDINIGQQSRIVGNIFENKIILS